VPNVFKSGNLNLLEPSGPLQACNGVALPLPLLKLEVEAFPVMLPTFVIGYRHFGTTYQNILQNQALDPLNLGPIDSPVSSVTNYQPTLNVWHPRCAVITRNEGNMPRQHTTTHRLQVCNSPFYISVNFSLDTINLCMDGSYFFRHVTTFTA